MNFTSDRIGLRVTHGAPPLPFYAELDSEILLLASNRVMKSFFAALFLPILAGAAIWPDAIGPYQKTATPNAPLADRAIWDEFGLKTAETALYQGSGKRFTATAYQLQDSTGALAAFDWQRKADAKPSKAGALAAETTDTLLLAHGNYLLLFSGYKPAAPELEGVIEGLRAVDATGLPTLPGYLPSDNLVANSERYITGPVALQAFVPGIPPSVAAFHLSAEAQLGVFHSPLVAVILSPADPDAAERLLAQVRYQAEITDNEYTPTRRDNIGNLVINAFILTGILGAFCIVSGLCAGGIRAIRRRGKRGDELDPMILLHLDRL